MIKTRRFSPDGDGIHRVPRRRDLTCHAKDLTAGTAVRGVLPDALATVVTVQWFGSEALELTYKDAARDQCEL